MCEALATASSEMARARHSRRFIQFERTCRTFVRVLAAHRVNARSTRETSACDIAPAARREADAKWGAKWGVQSAESFVYKVKRLRVYDSRAVMTKETSKRLT